MSWPQERKPCLQLAVKSGAGAVLDSLQCLGTLLFWVIEGQGSALLAAGAEWVGWLYFFSHLSRIFLLSFSGETA